MIEILSLCKPDLRRICAVGDVVVVFTGDDHNNYRWKHSPKGCIESILIVDEKMKSYDYFRDNFKDSTTNKANRMRRDCIYSILSRDKMETRLKNPRKDIMELIYFISRHKQNVEGDRDVVLSCHYIQLDDVDLDLSASLRNYARTKKRDNSLPAKFHQEIKDIMFRYRGKSKRNGVNSWKPFRCAPHRDAMNKGMNKIIGLPGYEGGELIVDGEYIDIRSKQIDNF